MTEQFNILAGSMVRHFRKEEQGIEYKPHKHKWFTDLLWKLMNKMRVFRPYMENVPYYKFEVQESNPNILKFIFENIQVQDVYNRPKDYAVVMGIDDYMRLKQQTEDNNPYGMPNNGFEFSAGPFGYRDKVFNIPVHVVTTMSGIALIPKVIIEVEQVRRHGTNIR